MKRNELLKLRPGKYLVMGEYSSLMILNKYNNEFNDKGEIIGVCKIYDYYAIGGNSKGLFISYYGLSQYCNDCGEYRDDYKGKYQFEYSAGVSGISVHGKFDQLYKISIIGLYNRETIDKDVKRYKMNAYINNEFIKSRNKKRIEERIKK